MKKIILVISNSKGKNIRFITNDFICLTIDIVIDHVKSGLLKGLHIVNSAKGTFVRSNPNRSSKDNLDSLSVSENSFAKRHKDPYYKDKVMLAYLKTRAKALELIYRPNELIYLGGLARGTKKDIFERFRPLKKVIKSASSKHNINPVLLTAILVDELVRLGLDDLFDVLGYFGMNTSIGLAQVRLSTAKDMIKKGYYNHSNKDISDQELYDLLNNDKHAVEFAASYIHWVYDYRNQRKMKVNDNNMATSYSSGQTETSVTPRGKSIINELYPIAKQILQD